ncbi:sensor histidine kinase [Gracilibacillus alcaliphilus]|uniref:sensor histidine kinase n=1 Tax=Gracilibacillus alcaliphilus TaxID=1401441 RepID=UPI00195CDEAD|nr:HAMP domain-containing sensor histidine kinase [Gracilibacillus alcaliphilus]MBM7676860.1 signal transduction histidine kinase [Gracilibacillus alcaliphilus]
MLIALILVSVIFMLQTIYFMYYKSQVKDIGEQLSFISKHHSFKFIQTQIKPKEIYQLIDVCNTLLRNQREQNQAFIRKNEEINETIVSLSHDIRTPLTSLDGYLQLAKRSENIKETTHYVTMAQTRIKQIITLVDELFLYTKLQHMDYQLKLKSMDLINMLKRRLFFFIDEFAKNGTEPHLDLPESPVYIIGNESALERVYENILRNYFLHGEGGLTIRYEEKQQEVVLHFSNLLKQNELINFNQIFTRFYKDDPSRSKPSSGLGLSIVKSLIEKMNGSVYAELMNNQFCLSVVFTKTEGGNGDEPASRSNYRG